MVGVIDTTVLAPSTIRLIGWVLTYGWGAQRPQLPLPEYQGESLLLNTIAVGDRQLAYILAYSYAGVYSPLRAPALFFVRGQGTDVAQQAAQSGAPADVDPGRLGLAHLDTTVKFATGLKFWAYDLSDQTVRLDASSGTLQQLVIDAETGGPHGRRRIDLVGQDSSFSGRFGVTGH